MQEGLLHALLHQLDALLKLPARVAIERDVMRVARLECLARDAKLRHDHRWVEVPMAGREVVPLLLEIRPKGARGVARAASVREAASLVEEETERRLILLSDADEAKRRDGSELKQVDGPTRLHNQGKASRGKEKQGVMR